MYRRVLVANRSDCALRLIAACHKLGIQAVVIAARDDANALIASKADHVVMTGRSREAYTAQDDILEAAVRTDCEAILPGWGFLSEDPYFAQRCRLLRRHFVGPKTPHLALFGDKLATLEKLAPAIGLPNHAVSLADVDFEEKCASLSFPLMLKRCTGGGGKDVYFCENRKSLDAYRANFLPSDRPRDYYVEPAIWGAQHIEFQILGNGNGEARVIAARDCTAQVRQQKWLEKSFDIAAHPWASEIVDKASSYFGSIQYIGLATLECLYEASGALHLLEINPRLQVEHGVTEMTHDIDLVEASLRLSCGETQISYGRDTGLESLEFRLYARSSGRIDDIGFSAHKWPDHPFAGDPNYRLESAAYNGLDISGIYDAMLARFIVRAPKGQALTKLKSWLEHFHIKGLTHNLPDLEAL